MKKALDRPALQLEAQCPGLAKPGLCTHTAGLAGSPLLKALPLPPWKRLLNATGICYPEMPALTHILVWREGGVKMTHGLSLGPEGPEMWRCCGTPRWAAHPFSVTEQEHWRLSVGREEATFIEHSLVLGSEMNGTRQPCFHGTPHGVGAVHLVGITEMSEPGRSGTDPP